jgi:hypothetical protein
MTLYPASVGDLAGKALSLFGITKKRVTALVGNCGCESRQSALNAWGYSVQYKIIMFVGGPSDVPFLERCRIVQGRLYRLWKTTTSK